MAFGSGSWYRRRALAQAGLRPGMRVLDVGVGTGLTAREAANLVGSTGQVTGVDPSAGMMERAIVPAGVKLLLGRADAVPLPPEAVDFHFNGLRASACRRPIPGVSGIQTGSDTRGRMCLLEDHLSGRPRGRVLFSRPTCAAFVPSWRATSPRHRDVPKFDALLLGHDRSLRQPSVIMSAIRDAGFVDVERTVSLGIFSEYCARKPLG